MEDGRYIVQYERKFPAGLATLVLLLMGRLNLLYTIVDQAVWGSRGR